MQLRDYQKKALNKAYSFINQYAGENGYILAPGGSGKSVMIAFLANQLARDGYHVVCLARSEKLVQQNYNQSPNKDICGIYCSGLGSQDVSKQITFATIQSIYSVRMPRLPDFVLCDECDEIHPDENSNTQYWHFFRNNNHPTIIGFTATDFRTKSGKISWGKKIYEIPLKRLLDAGMLCPPVSKAAYSPDVSNVRITAGEFNGKDIETIYDDPELLEISVKKIIQYMHGRNRALVFSQSVNHGKLLTENLNANGLSSIFVDGNTPKDDLRKILEMHEQGAHKVIVNCMLATVGYDLPWLDMVAVIRATNSKRLFEQMVYRGTRLYDGKENFLLLDMGGNLERHGPLGSPYKERAKREAHNVSPGKICPDCEEYVATGSTECPDCGYEFPEAEVPKIKHEGHASTAPTIYVPPPPTQWFDVTNVDYIPSKTKNGDECIIAKYSVNGWHYPTIRQWHMPHHAKDFPVQKCLGYFRMMGDDIYVDGGSLRDYPFDVLLERCRKNFTKKVKRIHVNTSGDFPDIIGYEFDEPPIDTKELLDDEIPF